MNLETLSPIELLKTHTQIAHQLKVRGVTRSYNNPVGDYAEYLFCRAFGWKQAPNSEKSYDAIDRVKGQRFQIKSRRLTTANGSRQLSQLRDLNRDCFEVLAGVLFREDYEVFRAALVPQHIVLEHSKFVPHTNSWRFVLRDEIWSLKGVVDVTSQLAKAQ